MATDNPTFQLDEGQVSSRANEATTVEIVENGKVDVEKNSEPLPQEAQVEHQPKSEMMYGVDDKPPWHLSLLLGMQHYLTMVGATFSLPYIITPLLCIDDNDPIRGTFVSTIIFVSGIITLFQSTFGIRLPIVQGGTFSFLVPTIAIMTTTYPKCEDLPLANMTALERETVWKTRIQEIQGAIVVSSFLQIFVGFSGLIGFVLTWITPLAIAPTVALVGLSLFSVAAEKAGEHWGLSVLTIVLTVLFSQYLRDISVTIPAYNRERGFHFKKAELFKLFPVLIAILFSWALCALLTAVDALPPDSSARTDIRMDIVYGSPWFYVPYPGQYGLPTVSAAGVLGMFAGVIASMIESIGDYYACARLAGAPPPPKHAINRGIGMEGIGCLLAGLWGTGTGTTSYSENIGAIGVTKVGSRRVIQVAALFMITVSVLGKVCALFVTIPNPVVGGLFCVMFGMISAVGLSVLQFVNLNSSRNLFVLGFSIFFGLALPSWIKNNPKAIQTGSPTFDQIITVILQTSMLVGGVLGVILDNTIPGTKEERGLIAWNELIKQPDEEEGHQQEEGSDTAISTYDFPFCSSWIRRMKWTSYLPVCPTYRGFKWRAKNRYFFKNCTAPS